MTKETQEIRLENLKEQYRELINERSESLDEGDLLQVKIIDENLAIVWGEIKELYELVNSYENKGKPKKNIFSRIFGI